MVIYQDLTDDDTVEKQIGKARAIFDRYRFISLNVQNRRKLYEGLVLSIALYGCATTAAPRWLGKTADG